MSGANKIFRAEAPRGQAKVNFVDDDDVVDNYDDIVVDVFDYVVYVLDNDDDDDEQSVTSRLETSRYRDFSQFFESIGLGLESFGLEKKSRYRSRKYLVSKKSLGIGLKNIWSRKQVSIF